VVVEGRGVEVLRASDMLKVLNKVAGRVSGHVLVRRKGSRISPKYSNWSTSVMR